MFTEEQIRELAPAMEDLERREPILAAWRYQEGAAGSPAWRHILSGLKTKIRRARLRKQSSLQSPSGRVILFPMSNTPATVGTILPILKELNKRGRSPFLVTRRSTAFIAEQGMHSGAVSIEVLKASSPPSGQRAFRKRAEAYAGDLADVIPVRDMRRTARWIAEGLRLREVVPAWIQGASALVMDSDISSFQKGIVLGAQRAGVPTFILQHGFFGEHQFPTTVDHLLCWGDYFAQIAKERFGVPEERLTVAGCPRWDDLPRLRNKPRDSSIRARLGGTPDRPLVLILSNSHAAKGYPEHYNAFFRSVAGLLKNKVDVAVKLHPSEGGLDVYRREIGPELTEKLRVVAPDIDLYEALRHSDVAFQVFTAAVLEAMLLGVPVLYEAGGNQAGLLTDIPEHGGGAWCTEKNIIEKVSNLSAESEGRRNILIEQDRFLEEALAFRGQAARMITTLLEQVPISNSVEPFLSSHS